MESNAAFEIKVVLESGDKTAHNPERVLSSQAINQELLSQVLNPPSTHTHTHTYIYIYTHTYIHTHIYTHTYTHIHTHTHTHTHTHRVPSGTYPLAPFRGASLTPLPPLPLPIPVSPKPPSISFRQLSFPSRNHPTITTTSFFVLLY